MNLQKNKDDRVRVVIVGHVDHGKSSLIGRLLYELDQIQDGKYEELKNVSESRGMDFEWAFLLDSLQTERNQGITIDKTEIFFSSKKKKYVFIDAPGHKEFLKNIVLKPLVAQQMVKESINRLTNVNQISILEQDQVLLTRKFKE